MDDMSNVVFEKKYKPVERWVILGDMQIPFHDAACIELARELIGLIKPEHIIYNGDNIDFWSISRHQPSRHELLKGISIQEEIDMTIKITDYVAEKAQNAERHQIDGNHESRWEKFFGIGPQSILGGLRDLQMHNVFKLEERGFSSYHPYGEGIWIIPQDAPDGGLFVYHGEYVGTLPGDSVKKEIAHIGSSVIMNHVHRRADLTFRQGGREYRGIENGCLCQFRSAYKYMTNWTHCITVVEVYGDGTFVPTVIDMKEEDGVVYCVYKDTRLFIPADYDDGLMQPWRPHNNLEFK